MKKVLLLVMSIVLLSSLAFGQVWVYDSDFAVEKNPHGVVVAPDGKVWVGNYSKTDTLVNAPGDTLFSNPIRVFNPDGSSAQLIRTVTVDGVLDTIINSCRGMSLDNNGNVLFTNWNVVYRINYLTYEGMNKFAPDNGASMTKASATDDGYIYCGHVGGGYPAYILDEDLALFGYVDDTLLGLQRALIVSGDGNDVYIGKIYTGGGNGMWHYQSTDGGGAESESFALVDTFGTVYLPDGTVDHAMWGQCIDWDGNGLIWMGTYWDVGTDDFSGWYALDPTQDYAVVDTLGHNADLVLGDGAAPDPLETPGGTYLAPRGLAFSADGKTAYSADYDGGMVKKWTNAAPKGPGSSIIPLSDMVVGIEIDLRGNRNVLVDFELKQNYPNPFNPSTSIPFTINATKQVTLKVYDVTGRLIATLIDSKLSPNTYNYKFDGSNLASGSYIYQLNVDGQLVNKQMLLIK